MGVGGGGGAVGAFDERGVAADALGREVEVQLDRVVARLAVDIDGAGELRGLGVVEPLVIGLPTVGRRDRAPRRRLRSWSSAYFAALVAGQHFGDARLAAEQLDDAVDRRRRRGPSRRRARTGDRPAPRPGVSAKSISSPPPSFVHRQQARLAQHAVGIGHVIDRRDDVLAGDQPQQVLRPDTPRCSRRPACRCTSSSSSRACLGLRAVGAGLLRGVVEVRQVDVEEVRLVLLHRRSRPNRRSRRST